MEKDPAQNGFEIKDSRIPILLSLRPIDSLKPHEETVGLELGLITNDLRQEDVLRHPLIADRLTGVMLDGTHRLAALKALKCHWVPCALVNYDDPMILVDRWFRVITGSGIDEFLDRVSTNTVLTDTTEGDERLARRDCYATLENGSSCRVFPCEKMSPVDLARAAFRLEQAARENGLRVKYADSKKTSTSKPRIMLSTVKLEKREIVESALAAVVFPPKTTRHIIPSRPLGISTPLEWLREEDQSKAEGRFVEDLRSKRVKRLPQGSKVGSRRYLEEVYVFS